MLLVRIIKKIKDKNGGIKNVFLDSLKTMVCILLVIAIPYGINYISGSIKSSTLSGYSEYQKLNSARSSVADYGTPLYDENKEYYDSIGISSQNDLDVYKTWIHDKEYFTIDKLQSISSFSEQSSVGYKFSVNLVLNLIKNKISEYTSINPLIVLIFLSFVFLL